MKRFKGALLFCMMICLISVTGVTQAAAEEQASESLPVISTINGQQLGEETLQGKVIVLDFWATWCMPCRKSIPELKKVYNRYKDQQGLVFIGMAEENSVEKVKSYVEKNEMRWTIAMDEDSTLAKRFDVKVLPGLMVLDRQHKVVWQGAVEDLDKALRKVLEQQG